MKETRHREANATSYEEAKVVYLKEERSRTVITRGQDGRGLAGRGRLDARYQSVVQQGESSPVLHSTAE